MYLNVNLNQVFFPLENGFKTKFFFFKFVEMFSRKNFFSTLKVLKEKLIVVASFRTSIYRQLKTIVLYKQIFLFCILFLFLNRCEFCCLNNFLNIRTRHERRYFLWHLFWSLFDLNLLLYCYPSFTCWIGILNLI